LKIILVINLRKKIVYFSFYFNLKIVRFFCRTLYNIWHIIRRLRGGLARVIGVTHHHHHHHHHHYVHEGLGVFPVPWSSKWNWSLHLFLGRPMFLRPFSLHCNACFDILFVSILCTCCSHFFWYCFISFTMFCAPVFPLIHWFFSLSSFVIPSNCLKNFICAASKRCSSLFFSTQASLPNFSAALAVSKHPYNPQKAEAGRHSVWCNPLQVNPREGISNKKYGGNVRLRRVHATTIAVEKQ